MSWRTKARQTLKKEREEAEKRKKQAAEGKLEQEQRLHQEALQVHQTNLKCHLCDRPSEGPTIISLYPFLAEEDAKIPYTLWDQPSSLIRCDKCRKWVCSNCEEQGRCRKCFGL